MKPNILFILTVKADHEDLNQRYYHISVISSVVSIKHHLAMHPSFTAFQCFVVNTTGALSLKIRKCHPIYLPNSLL